MSTVAPRAIRLASSLLVGVAFAGVLVLALFLLGAPPAYATVGSWYVATTGINNSGCGSVGSPCMTIAYMIAKASVVNGDAINIAAGTYTQTLTITVAKSLNFVGAGAATTIVNGSGINRVFNITSGGNVSFSGLTIQNGKASGSNGGGILANNTLTLLTLTNVNVLSNTAGFSGGALYAAGTASTSITGVDFISNTASSNGGAVYVVGTASITGTDFISNTASSNGGAVYVVGTASITGTDFISNTAVSYGGAVYVAGTASITDTDFISNTAVGNGGGIYSTGTLTVNNSNVYRNSAVYGGGIDNKDGRLTVNNSTVYGNSAAYGGAGGAGSAGGGIYNFGSTSTLMVDNSTVSGLQQLGDL